MENIIFVNIGLIIVIATALAYITRLLKQPLIPSYILTGILIGPFVFKIITDVGLIRTISEIGVAFLLFVVGIELSFKKLKNIGMIASLGGTARSMIIFTTALIIALLIGFNNLESAYLAVIITLCSTTVVVKLLSDKQELDSLHGRIIIGFLLLEDLIAIIALSIMTTLGSIGYMFIIEAFLKGGLLLIIAFICSKYIFPKMFRFAAKSSEFLFLMSIAVCFLFSLISYAMNFSIAIGAFMAGITLANLPYNYEIIGRVKPIRDFFATLFFVSLGMELMVNSIREIIIPVILFLALILILKPIVTMFVCSFFEYAKRTSFMTSINLTQISEFSLIIAAQGLFLGHIQQNIFTLTIVLAVITIGITPYLSKYDKTLYKRFGNTLKPFEKWGNGIKEMEYKPKKEVYDTVVIGADRIGHNIINKLKKLNKKIIVIDFNPDLIRRLIEEKIPCIYGDIGDPEIIERLDVKKIKMVISTSPNKGANSIMLNKIKQKNKKTLIFVTAYDVEEALELYKDGADYVILPHFLGSDRVSLMLEDVTTNINKFFTTKIEHITELRKRHELGHKHPVRVHD